VCVRQNPLCTVCPVQGFCAAARSGEPESYPRLTPKRIELRSVTRVWCERGDSLLLHRAAAGARRLASQHELPTAEQAGLAVAKVTAGRLLAKKRRAITRFQITESIYVAAAPRAKAEGRELVWIALTELDAITLSGPHRRWIQEILAKKCSIPDLPQVERVDPNALFGSVDDQM
jgi:A/G-specific adenine glycosylase